MGKKLPAFIMVALSVALLSTANPVCAAGPGQVATVYAVGRSRIQGADMSASQRAAITDSLVTAVTMVVTELIPPQTAVGNFQAISEAVLSKTDQFVVDYKMLTESTSGQDHRVMVKVNVSVERLTRALNSAGIPVSQKQYPRILYCIAERWADADEYRYWWADQPMGLFSPASDTLSEEFKKQGYPVVVPNSRVTAALPALLSPEDAVRIGRQFGADVVIFGRAEAQEAPNTMGATLRSFSASVSVSAFSVGSGQEIARARRVFVSTSDDPAYGSRESISTAARLAGEDLTKQVARAWFAEGAGATEIEIFVEGISGHVASFVRFRGALSTMSGVDSVQRREMQQDTAVLVISYQGNVKALADAMLRQNFDTFGLNIFEAQGNHIRLQLVPHQNQ